MVSTTSAAVRVPVLGMTADRDAPAVVDDLAAAVGQQRDVDVGAVARPWPRRPRCRRPRRRGGAGPDGPVEPMYMPGRRRTASRPSRTWMSWASYDNGCLSPRSFSRALPRLPGHTKTPLVRAAQAPCGGNEQVDDRSSSLPAWPAPTRTAGPPIDAVSDAAVRRRRGHASDLLLSGADADPRPSRRGPPPASIRATTSAANQRSSAAQAASSVLTTSWSSSTPRGRAWAAMAGPTSCSQRANSRRRHRR